MKVTLVFSPIKKKPQMGEVGEKINPPLGILYLASAIKNWVEGVEVTVIDGLFHGYNKTMQMVKDSSPDMLGISFYTLQAQSAYAFTNEFKAQCSSVPVILGGPHVTALPFESLSLSKADLSVIGEGEVTFTELVKNFQKYGTLGTETLFHIDGIAYRENGKIKISNTRKFIENLDDIPFPAFDLINIRDYSGFYYRKTSTETIILFSRGCPYQCTFCSNKVWNVSKPSVRFRSPKNIVDEMEMIQDKYGIKVFFDNSDEFNQSLKNAIAICDELIRRNLNIYWKTQLRATPLSEELVQKMKQSGCWYVHLGIESSNPETLKGTKKNITIEEVISACELLKKYDIKILGLFMIYNVWEESGQLKFEDTAMTKNTLRFAQKMVNQKLLDFVGWAITTPYPGSTLYDIALKHKLIKPEIVSQWDNWLTKDSFVMRLPGITEKEQARMKTLGSFLMAKCTLKEGFKGFRNLGLIMRKGIKVLLDEVVARRGCWSKFLK